MEAATETLHKEEKQQGTGRSKIVSRENVGYLISASGGALIAASGILLGNALLNPESNSEPVITPVQPSTHDTDAATTNNPPRGNTAFGKTFAEQRALLGEGGIYEHNGMLYHTYYKEEWDALTPEEKKLFAQKVENYKETEKGKTQPETEQAVAGAEQKEETGTGIVAGETNNTTCYTSEITTDDLSKPEESSQAEKPVQMEEFTMEFDGNQVHVIAIEDNADKIVRLDMDNDGIIDREFTYDNAGALQEVAASGHMMTDEPLHLQASHQQMADFDNNMDTSSWI